jgi:hypothetical protein
MNEYYERSISIRNSEKERIQKVMGKEIKHEKW